MLILSIAAYLSLSLYNKPHLNVAETSPKVKLISSTLLEDFEEDENTANANYLGQVIQVSGTIKELGMTDGNGTITLNSGNSFGSVICNLMPEENKKILQLKRGHLISIKGICTGYLMDVILVRSVIIN